MKMPPRFLKILPSLVILALVFVMALALLDDSDVWWHLKCGELFLGKGWIPREEIFSYTSAGAPWVDGYLFAQALLYSGWYFAGASGVCLLGAILVTASYALALLMSRNRPGYYAALAVSLPAACLSINSNTPRPALFTPLFALITLSLLENHRAHGGKRIWGLIPLMVLWVNSHPAFFIGPLITVFYIVGAIHELPLRRRLTLLLAAQLLATFINPYGSDIYYTTLSFFSDPRYKELIFEWKPLFSEPEVFEGVRPVFIILVVLGSAVFVWAGRASRLEHVLLFGLTALSAAISRRNLLLFAVLVPPIISWTVSGALGARRSNPLLRLKHSAAVTRMGGGLISFVALFLVWFTATDRLYFYQHNYRKTGLGVNRTLFSGKMAELLNSERLEGNIFHQYSMGGYFIFKLYPNYRVFIDGRMYPYSFDLFWNDLKAVGTPQFFEQLSSRYDIRAVVLMLNAISSPLMEHLLKSRDWAAVFADDSGVLFVERGRGNDAIISRREINLLAEPPLLTTRPPGRSFHLWDKAEFPFSIINWGMAYQQLGRPDMAARVFKEALNYRPVMKELGSMFGE